MTIKPSSVAFNVADGLLQAFGFEDRTAGWDKLPTIPNPLDFGYSDYEQFKRLLFRYHLLRKCPSLHLVVDTRQVAIDSFLKSNARMKEVNRQLAYRVPTARHAVISTAARKISKLLGDFSWDKVVGYFRIGPKSSKGLRFSERMVPNKLHHGVYATSNLSPLVPALRSYFPGLFLPEPRVEENGNLNGHQTCRLTSGSVGSGAVRLCLGSTAACVPKDARSDRFIAPEPFLNLFVQYGFGGYFAERLKVCGNPLDTQERNQELARIGSTFGNYATIDLSNASNSISLGVVKLLLPDDWYRAMLLCRSPSVTISGPKRSESTHHRLHMMSTMGNGFTFELESLIFWALAQSVRELSSIGTSKDVVVFGDDIVCPSVIARDLMSVLEDLGFAINVEKTYVAGPYRESCGKHYFYGREVELLFIDTDLVDPLDKVIFANQIRKYSHLPYWGVCDGAFKEAYQACVDGLSPSYRSSCIEAGDIGLIVPRAEAKAYYTRESADRQAIEVRGKERSLRPRGDRFMFLQKSRGIFYSTYCYYSCLYWGYRSSRVLSSSEQDAQLSPFRDQFGHLEGYEDSVRRYVTQWSDYGPWTTDL